MPSRQRRERAAANRTASACAAFTTISTRTSAPRRRLGGATRARVAAGLAPAPRRRRGLTSKPRTAKPARDEVLRHRQAHGSKTDEADRRHRSRPSLRRQPALDAATSRRPRCRSGRAASAARRRPGTRPAARSGGSRRVTPERSSRPATASPSPPMTCGSRRPRPCRPVRPRLAQDRRLVERLDGRHVQHRDIDVVGLQQLRRLQRPHGHEAGGDDEHVASVAQQLRLAELEL